MRHVAAASKFSTVAPTVCEASFWNFLHITILGPGIFPWLLNFCTIGAALTLGLLKIKTKQSVCLHYVPEHAASSSS